MGSLASHIMIPRHVSPACDKEPVAGVLYVRPNISLRPSIPSNRLHRGALMHAESTRHTQPILELSQIRKNFGDHEILNGVDLTVKQKELVFIIGPSGSGKSTLLRCCNRLEEPTHRSVKVCGQDIISRSIDLNHIRTRIGMVFQAFNLNPHMSALQNVTIDRKRTRLNYSQ